MEAVVLALTASFGWGLSDFLGGLTSRHARLALVLAGSQLAGLVGFAPILLLHGVSLPDDPRLWASVAAGVIAVGELALIYVALLRSTAVIMAPIAALSALLPVAVGLLDGDRLTGLIGAGLVCGLGGAVAAAWSPADQRSPRREVLISAAVAGGGALGAGLVLTLIDVASRANPWWAVAGVRVGGVASALSLLVVSLFLAGRRHRAEFGGRIVELARRATPGRLIALAIVGVGLSDALADTAFANATRGGPLSVAAVLASLYPVTTIALGVLVLRERPGRVQLLGAALALVGVALLAWTSH